MKTITIDDVMSLHPCYTREEIEAATGGRTELTLLEVCDVQVKADHILWLLLRRQFLPVTILQELACQFAEHALLRERAMGREPDQRSWAAIEARRKWLRGEATDEELAGAAKAAWLAANTAACAPARLAANAAAWTATWTETWTATGEAAARAATAVAWGSADAAAWTAEREWQLAQVRAALAGLQDDTSVSPIR